MTIVSSLNKFVAGDQVLSALGVPVKNYVLPAITVCPICRHHQLHVYRDAVYGGEWAHCRNCSFSGDMIELSATYWKLEIPTTLQKLRDHRITLPEEMHNDESIANYLQNVVRRRRTALIYWARCQDQSLHCTNPNIRHLMAGLGAVSNMSPKDWFQHGGQYLGASTKKLTDACWIPAVEARKRAIRKTGRGAGQHYSSGGPTHTIFPGPGWDEVLVIPFSDLPGRFSGFLYLGREGDPQKDFIFYPVCPRITNQREAGLAMLSALCPPIPHPLLGNSRFIFTDPMLALRLQLRHLRDNFLPLPLSAAHRGLHSLTSLPWDWLPAEQLILWSPQPTLQAFRFARAAGAQVSTFVVTPKELVRSMNHCPSIDWLYRIKRCAVPWQVALRQCLRQAVTEKVEEALNELEIKGPELREFIAHSDGELKERLHTVVAQRRYPISVTYNGREVVEKNGGWWCKKTEVCNAIIRIERILHARNGKCYYEGHIKFEGQTHPFTEPTTTLDNRLFGWARELIFRKLGRRLQYAPNWAHLGASLAVAFHAPETVSAAVSVGWDAEQQAFALPRYLITKLGEIQTDQPSLLDPVTSPAVHLRPETMLLRPTVERLSENHGETQVFWAMLGAVTSAVISPAVHQTLTNLYLDGAVAQTLGRSLAEQMGCLILHSWDRAKTALREHRWPALLDQPVTSEIIRRVSRERLQGLIVMADTPLARVLGIRGEWIGICHPTALGSLRLTDQLAGSVLSAYLYDLCVRRLWLPGTGDFCDLLADIAEWFQVRCGGSGSAVEAALKVLELPERSPPWQHFIRLVISLLGRELFPPVAIDSHTGPAPGIVVHPQEQPGVWVAQQRFSNGVQQIAQLPPDMLLITKSLRDAGALLDESTYRGERGWRIQEDWWSARYRELCPQEPGVEP